MADKLRPDELAAFKAAFDMFDKNQDGTISTKVRRYLYHHALQHLHALCCKQSDATPQPSLLNLVGTLACYSYLLFELLLAHTRSHSVKLQVEYYRSLSSQSEIPTLEVSDYSGVLFK